MPDVDRRYYITTDESGTVDLSDDLGSVTILYEPWEDTWHGFQGGEPYKRHIERAAGVYLPENQVRGGTLVQNDREVLEAIVEQLTEVARRAAGNGWNVYGAGKNHDNTIQVFADTSEYDVDRPAHFDGNRFLGTGPFRGCTVMGIPLKWWDHSIDEPVMAAPALDQPDRTPVGGP